MMYCLFLYADNGGNKISGCVDCGPRRHPGASSRRWMGVHQELQVKGKYCYAYFNFSMFLAYIVSDSFDSSLNFENNYN